MENEKIMRPLMALFSEDITNNKGPSHITDLIVLTIKSLIPSENYVEVNIDYGRYEEEIKLWKYYRHGENTSLLNILDDIDPHIYWHHKDDTTYLRILPIVLTNKDYSIVKKEVIKNILFTTGNIEILIEVLLLSKLLYLLIIDEEDIIEKLKEEVIKFSQVEFMEDYKDKFRIPVEKYEGNFPVEFEQNKIYALNILNLSSSQKFEILKDSIEVLINNKTGNTSIGKCINDYIDEKSVGFLNIDNYYSELGMYICNLRKGRINPQVLRIEEYDLPDVFQFNEGDVFYHSLLNKSKVIKKEEIDDKIITYISSKSGVYKLTK